MKYIIYIIGLVLLLSFVSAYDVGDTVRINAQYKENGVLTNTTTKINIQLPTLAYDVLNQTMNQSSTGIYYYDYVPMQEGEYQVSVNFYDGNTLQGTDNSFFDVGDVNSLKFGTCPDGNRGNNTLLIFITLIIIMGVIGMTFNIPVLTLLTGFLLILATLITWNCGKILGIFTIVTGIIYLLIGATQSPK